MPFARIVLNCFFKITSERAVLLWTQVGNRALCDDCLLRITIRLSQYDSKIAVAAWANLLDEKRIRLGELIHSRQQRHKLEDTMRHSPILSTTLVISIVSLAGCEIAGDIFKAGVWVGAILLIGIIGLVIWMLTKAGS